MDVGQDKTVAPRTLNVNVIQSPCGVFNKIRSGQTPVFILSMLEPWAAGLKGGPKRRIKMEEVKLHKAEDDSWTVLRGKVFNITPYFNFHPGGKLICEVSQPTL